MKILKPGEEGYGYIIEYDAGYVNSNISHRGKKNEDIINETLLREFKNNLTSDGPLPDKIELYAVLQKWGVENKNGRVYTEEILRREADRYQEFIDMGTSLGELNHPESSIIDGERVSHAITEIWWEGSTLMGKMELDTTPGYHKMGIISSVGDKVLNMIRKGWTVGISSRGVGSLKQEGGKNVVQDDFELICWDIVTSPSTPGSWISTNQQDLVPYMESVKKVNDDKLLSEEESKLLNNLNNFLL